MFQNVLLFDSERFTELPIKYFDSELMLCIVKSTRKIFRVKKKILFYCVEAIAYTCEIWKIHIIFGGGEGAIKEEESPRECRIVRKSWKEPKYEEDESERKVWWAGTNWNGSGTNAPTRVCSFIGAAPLHPITPCSYLQLFVFQMTNDLMGPLLNLTPHVAFKAHL